ncbi:hypothetical protein [Spiroplasma sp. AdecLV25b]|uniref:hypothetical protein n=1 Tax=Spiroplasma sp. AdecLV25b TaxID=3027162 RepID=UPI0027E00036|nr:hypothetical protein [Spiroplasma sp. AdecLV25b]
MKQIWKDYVQNKIYGIFKSKNNFQNWDLSQEAPCSRCGKTMLKSQYQGVQPDKDYSWDVDHIDSNPRNNF